MCDYIRDTQTHDKFLPIVENAFMCLVLCTYNFFCFSTTAIIVICKTAELWLSSAVETCGEGDNDDDDDDGDSDGDR